MAGLAQGYEIHSFIDHRQLHALHREVRRDILSDEPWTDVDFEEWIKGRKHPHFYGDGCFAAIKGDEWAGIRTSSFMQEKS